MALMCEYCNKEYSDDTKNGRCMFCGKVIVEDSESNCLQFTQIGDKQKSICPECAERRGLALDQMSM